MKLEAPNAYTRKIAAELLGRYNNTHTRIIDALRISAASDSDPTVRSMAEKSFYNLSALANKKSYSESSELMQLLQTTNRYLADEPELTEEETASRKKRRISSLSDKDLQQMLQMTNRYLPDEVELARLEIYRRKVVSKKRDLSIDLSGFNGPFKLFLACMTAIAIASLGQYIVAHLCDCGDLALRRENDLFGFIWQRELLSVIPVIVLATLFFLIYHALNLEDQINAGQMLFAIGIALAVAYSFLNHPDVNSAAVNGWLMQQRENCMMGPGGQGIICP